MASTYMQRWSDPQPGQARRRGGSLLLAIVIHIFIILLLLHLAPLPDDRERTGSALKTFQVAASHATAKAKRSKAVKLAARQAAPSRPKPRVEVASHSNATTSDASAIWSLGRGMYKGSDIAAIASAKQGEAAETADAGSGGGGEGDRKGAGAGPGGAADAEWYREPSEAEMRPYVPRAAAPGNWGVIVCQTAPDYRVENCRELEQSPPGIGISRALRQASFQFKVRPPRANGKAIMGAWVKIRFYIVDGGMSLHR